MAHDVAKQTDAIAAAYANAAHAVALAGGGSNDDAGRAATIAGLGARLGCRDALAADVSIEELSPPHAAAAAVRSAVMADGAEPIVAMIEIVRLVTEAAAYSYRNVIAGGASIEDASQTAALVALTAGVAYCATRANGASAEEAAAAGSLAGSLANHYYSSGRKLGASIENAQQTAAMAAHLAGAAYRVALAGGASVKDAMRAATYAVNPGLAPYSDS